MSELLPFVVLHHQVAQGSVRPDHFDLMLQRGGGLETFALDAWPIPDGGCSAIELPPHRLTYLSYEGPIARDRGSVQRVAQGHYREIQRTDDVRRWILEPDNAASVMIEAQKPKLETMVDQRWWIERVAN
jgi:hypothetical protein